MLNTVKTLCALNGVASWEDDVRKYLKEQAAPFADEMRVDALGNLIIFKKGKKATGNKLMLCAHMDEVGIIIKRIEDDGYLRFLCVGGIDRRVLIGKKVLIGPKKIQGVIGLKAYHLVSAEEEKKTPKLEDLYIDIGAKDKESAEELISLGDVGAFDSDCLEFGEGLLKAKALDDRVGCAVLLNLLKKDLPMDCTFAFTVQEEVAIRGAYGAAFSVNPEIALVVESTSAADIPFVENRKRVCALGKGPVIPFMDGSTVVDRGLFEQLRDLAEKNEVPWQTKEYVAGGTDAQVIQRTRDGARVCVVSAPVRYLHAPASVGCVKDFENIYKLVGLFVENLAAQC